MNKLLILFMVLMSTYGSAQPLVYTAANLHSHNDYEKPFPFTEAYNQEFGSIEADIFLRSGNLIVAHDTTQLKLGRTLDSLYLQPLEERIRKNRGFPYADHLKVLQLLIDIKTDSTATLDRLVKKMQSYPDITNCKGLKIVISGSRPDPGAFASYPPWIYFDGELHAGYAVAAMNKIEMLSDNFRDFSTWNGIDTLSLKDKKVLEQLIAKGHHLHKKVRFWNAPDFVSSWKVFMQLGVDYINTDHITEAATFLRQTNKH